MDSLPDLLVWEICNRIDKTEDRNSVSLTCKRLMKMDGEQRKFIRVGCGLDPVSESLTSICKRFPYLEKIEIVYAGWMSRLGRQLDDEGLGILSNNCPFLSDLTLNYCTFITDAGLSSLASCPKLSALKLKFAPRITGFGILSVVMGCKKLTLLHLIRCFNVASAEWLEYLGNLQTFEDLCIKNCRAIGEGDLIKLGASWRTLKRFHFENDANYRYVRVRGQLSVDSWERQQIPCTSMQELSLVNCINSCGRGLACVLGKCENLEKIHIDTCDGLRDSEIVCLAKNAKNLRSISLRVFSDFSVPFPYLNPLKLTDESLKGLAENCSQLESVRLSCADENFPSYSPFTLDGIITLIRMCPIRELALDHVHCFDDVGMDALRSATCLEVLEIVGCQEVTDVGIQLVAHCQRLQVLRLSKCLGVSDDGIKLLTGACRLEMLAVEDCPQISDRGVHGAAKSVTFRQDLSWMKFSFQV